MILLIVCFEGIDGAGKETQAKLLKKHFDSKGIESTIISHPDYSSASGKLINYYLHSSRKTEIRSLFLAFVSDIVKDTQLIQDADRKGVAILDRYYPSPIAYQTAAGMDKDSAEIIVAALKPPQPDFIFYLDIQPEVSSNRTGGRDRQQDNF